MRIVSSGLNLLAADIKRFLERPSGDPSKIMRASAPLGAPIGDMPQDWLARPKR